MRLILGIILVIASVIGGYVAMGGHIEVLIQPFEAVIILGAAAGAYIIGNTGPVLKQTIGVFGILLRGSRYN
ncbi:MAG: motility-associated protein, partial [Devosia sp.]